MANSSINNGGDILTMLGAMIVAAGVIGSILTRLISRPAQRCAMQPCQWQKVGPTNRQRSGTMGLRELASLGESVADMAAKLTQRSKEITTYTDHVTHELKSPVTTIVGAAELLESGAVEKADRAKLISNIAEEGQRMNVLLSRLREMTLMRTAAAGDRGALSEMLPALPGLEFVFEKDQTVLLPLTVEHGRIILLHMAQNAEAHNATTMRIDWYGKKLTISDDGDGIDPNEHRQDHTAVLHYPPRIGRHWNGTGDLQDYFGELRRDTRSPTKQTGSQIRDFIPDLGSFQRMPKRTTDLHGQEILTFCSLEYLSYTALQMPPAGRQQSWQAGIGFDRKQGKLIRPISAFAAASWLGTCYSQQISGA